MSEMSEATERFPESGYNGQVAVPERCRNCGEVIGYHSYSVDECGEILERWLNDQERRWSQEI